MAKKVVPPWIWAWNFFLVKVFDVYIMLVKKKLSLNKVLGSRQKCVGLLLYTVAVFRHFSPFFANLIDLGKPYYFV